MIKTRGRVGRMLAAGLVGMLVTAVGATEATAKRNPLSIVVLSARADLVSGGDALVVIKIAPGVKPSAVTVRAGSRNVTSAFALRENGRFEGLITGLPEGRTLLKARAHGHRATSLAILNHANGGPLFAGPQKQPWVCEAGAVDKQCNRPASVGYKYKSSITGQFATYNPKSPAADVATTTTDQGVRVPYVVRVETGYQDRDQYAIAVLDDPAKPWTPWAPQKQFNHKLLITHGASCGLDHTTGTAPDVVNDPALSRGFAVMSTALDNAGHNCNLVTQAESLVMAKEHLVEELGTLRYTIGTGCSGGSLTQQQVANAYPGVYQGILPQCSFPDAWSTGQQLADYHLDRAYFENPLKWGLGILWNPLQIAAVEGHPNHANAIILDTLYFGTTADATSACAGVPASARWSATNTKGVRCTLADDMINVMGTRPDGYAGRPIDNEGVEYGLNALKSGVITPAQFVDLNATIGGADINGRPESIRTAADSPALANVYRSGGVNEGNNLRNVAIIDLRGNDPGAFHDVYRAFAVRARLDQQNGTHANQVIWEGLVPILGDLTYTTTGLIAMDRWLSGVESDHSDKPLARKIIADKPASIHDQCTDGAGTVIPSDDVCTLINPIFSTPRIESGESIATDQVKCRVKPLRTSDFTPYAQFTPAQWAKLLATFPGGVCDWSKPGVDQQPTIPWLTYQRPNGAVVTGGTSVGPAPHGSGAGWTSASFDSWRQAITATGDTLGRRR